ncbi:MAG: shikimate dehydrogenase [Pseudomonadota bacterium]
MKTKAFVTGWPISHSKSPALHSYWLEQYGIEGSYEPIAVEEGNFEEFLAALKSNGFVGGNVTIPHKETAFRLIGNLDAAARAIGAVNTLWFEDDHLHGSNTDAYGFMANLDDYHSQWRDGEKALVIGAGGASRAVVYALIEAGFSQINIANRTYERAENLANDFGNSCFSKKLDEIEKLLPDMDFVVNTTSLGMVGQGSGNLPDLSGLSDTAVVTDIVYTPLMTPFLATAQARGLKAIDGLGMLLHQAVPGFEKWFGKRPEVTPDLRRHVLDIK